MDGTGLFELPMSPEEVPFSLSVIRNKNKYFFASGTLFHQRDANPAGKITIFEVIDGNEGRSIRNVCEKVVSHPVLSITEYEDKFLASIAGSVSSNHKLNDPFV